MRDTMVKILLDYVKAHHIPISSVVLELFADELIKHGVVIATRCEDCKHRTEDDFCYQNIEGVSYKKTHIFGFCDKGEKK